MFELSLVSAEVLLLWFQPHDFHQSKQNGSRNAPLLLAVLLMEEQVLKQSFGKAGASKGCEWFHPDCQLMLAKSRSMLELPHTFRT